MAEHKHGTMNSDVQEKVFGGFIKASSYVGGTAILVLILLALFRV